MSSRHATMQALAQGVWCVSATELSFADAWSMMGTSRSNRERSRRAACVAQIRSMRLAVKTGNDEINRRVTDG